MHAAALPCPDVSPACHSHPLPSELEFYLLHKPDKEQLLEKQGAMAADAALGRPAGGSIARPPVLPLPLDGHNYSGAAGFEGAAPGRFRRGGLGASAALFEGPCVRLARPPSSA